MKKERSRGLYSAHIAFNANFANAYGNRGATYNDLGNKQKAIEDMKKAVDLFCSQGYSNCQIAQKNLKDLQK
jgi:hypothetical protein